LSVTFGGKEAAEGLDPLQQIKEFMQQVQSIGGLTGLSKEVMAMKVNNMKLC